MSKLITSKIFFSFILFTCISFQIFIIFLNNNDHQSEVIFKNSLDNFETIMFNKDGNNIIKAKKLVYVSEEETLLYGNSSLKNDNHEIISSDIVINFENGNAKSLKYTQFKNQSMNVISNGFVYNKSLNLVEFLGNTEIVFLND